MFRNIENPKLLHIMKSSSSRRHTNINRPHHGFVYKINGESVYDFGGKKIYFRTGNMIYLPKGSTYSVEKLSYGESKYVLIDFEADIKNPLPKIFESSGFFEKKFVLEEPDRLWLLGDKSDKFKCLSIFYDILSFVSKTSDREYAGKNKLDKIRPATQYLKNNIFNPELKVDTLHTICQMSDTYFRKIFKANFGVTPQEYIINKRLTEAKSIIAGKDYNSIKEVALSVGYSDALYFSRIFTAKYGCSPTAY